MKESPSSNQLYVISIIEKNTPHRFNGSTMSHAYHFIKKHIDESREATKRFNAKMAQKQFPNHQPYFEEPPRSIPPEFLDAGDDEVVFGEGSGLGDVTGEAQNNGHYGMPDPEEITFGMESRLGEF